MSTRGFAYNPTQSSVSGASNVGTLCIQEQALDLASSPGGLTWWMGPEESGAYIIAKDVPTEDFPTPLGNIGGVQFWSCYDTSQAFIDIVTILSGTSQSTTGDAYNWLVANDYWTNFNVNLDGFNYTNFSSTSGLVQVSTDGVLNDWLYVTNILSSNVGNVYRSSAIKYDRDFSVEWLFNCSDGTGADGYCLQWTTTNNTNGSIGGGVGYIASANTANAILFKTHTNNSVTWLKANASQSVTNVSSGFFRQNVYGWLDYDHSASTGYLYYSTSSTKPVSPTITLNNFSFDSSNYYMGFGAATGGATDYHILKSWKLTFT
jgi:hypothetical protein